METNLRSILLILLVCATFVYSTANPDEGVRNGRIASRRSRNSTVSYFWHIIMTTSVFFSALHQTALTYDFSCIHIAEKQSLIPTESWRGWKYQEKYGNVNLEYVLPYLFD